MTSKNPVDYMLDNLSYDPLEGVGFVADRDPSSKIIPAKGEKKGHKWYYKRTQEEKKRIEDAIKRKADIIDKLWRKYE